MQNQLVLIDKIIDKTNQNDETKHQNLTSVIRVKIRVRRMNTSTQRH